MGFSESDSSNCRKHPNHRQSPGVCSFCLREQLSRLNTTSPPSYDRNNTYIVSNSSTPPARSRTHRRNGSEAYVSVGLLLNNHNNINGLKKSRSVSCANLSSRSSRLGANGVITEKIKTRVVNEVAEEPEPEGSDDSSSSSSSVKKKKNGFLKKLINNTSRKTKGVLMQSKTMKERSHSSLNPNPNPNPNPIPNPNPNPPAASSSLVVTIQN